MCGAWGCTAAWDTLWHGSATCSPHRTGVAAAARDMLPPQDLLTCSEPPFLPFAFGPHPLGLLLRPPSCPFFCSRLLVPPEPHLHLMISAPRTLSPPAGSGAGGDEPAAACAWVGGGLVASGTPPCLAEELACATLPWHTKTPWQTGALPGPQSCLRGGPGEGTHWVSRHHPTVPHGYPWARGTTGSQKHRTLIQPSRLPVISGWPDSLAGAP